MLVRLQNLLGLLGVCLVLVAAFYLQLAQGELPCPLCLLQRGCFVALGIAFVLNLQFGSSPVHYGLMLVSAMVGAATSLRQILLHIAPGDRGYVSSFLGLHLYSWAFVAFSLAILYVALMLIVEARVDAARRRIDIPNLAERLCIWLFALLVAANLASTFLECGLGACPDNPTAYDWLNSRL